MFNKKGASFATIVAVFGSILIALGVAWLIAQNWHQLPGLLKIIILLSATSGAYVAGTMLRVRGYVGISKALLILGSLLYTLSIFLIAQTFDTSISWQGNAWLLLLAWVGVLASAYIFNSSATLVVGLAEFCVWLVMQFLAFTEKARFYPESYGVLALYFLAAGLLVYGLSLLHRSVGHKFGRVYLGWTAFYFLAFTYVMSFKFVLSGLWSESIKFSPATAFLLLLLVTAVAALVSGIVASLNRRAVQGKEVAGVFALVMLLILLVLSASIVSVSVGTCDQKQCYDLKDESSCVNSKLQVKCGWAGNYCTEGCSYLNDESSCTQNSCNWAQTTGCRQCIELSSQGACEASSNCKWVGASCAERESCAQYTTQTGCENANLNCEWLNNYCSPVQKQCYAYQTQNSCERANCDWATTGQCSVKYADCYFYRDANSCEAVEGCAWEASFCTTERPCEKYSNDKAVCGQHAECKWGQGGYFGRGGVPLSLWAVWIFANVIFVLLALAVIGYGTWQKMARMINMGIIFFSWGVLTRYLEFAISFWGFAGLGIVFIAGGLALLAGAYFIERWRRNLVARAKGEDTKLKNARSGKR